MNSKERLLKALNFEEPDRPPIYASFTLQAAEKMYRHFAMEPSKPLDSPMSSLRISFQDLLMKLGVDCICVASCAPDNAPTRKRADGLNINEWGIGTRSHGLYDEFELFPLAHAETKEDIEKYTFPDPYAPGRFRFAEETIRKFGNEYGIIGDLECSLFETSWYLVGLEKFLMDLLLETPYVEPLLDKVMHIHTAIGKRLIELGVDMIWCGDDFGTQSGLMIGLDIFDKYFAPRIKYMFEEFRKVRPDIKIAWHTCGSVLPLIPRFIDLGLDVLNPIQPMASGMEPEWLKDTYGKKLAFFGGICVQKLLPTGTVKEIKDEVKRRISILGKGGGYIIAPAHNIQDDTPVENVLAFFEAARQ